MSEKKNSKSENCIERLKEIKTNPKEKRNPDQFYNYLEQSSLIKKEDKGDFVLYELTNRGKEVLEIEEKYDE